MKKYNAIVWYRYAVRGELEKDFDDMIIRCNSPDEAIEIAKKAFNTRTRTVFKVEIKQLND